MGTIFVIIGIIVIAVLVIKFRNDSTKTPIDSPVKPVDIKSNSAAREDIHDESLGTNKTSRKSSKTWGTFSVAGFHHLPEETKTMIWKELKEGDQLYLIADPSNTYDKEAIKVLFKDQQIGWVSRDYSRKKFLFQALLANKEVTTICTKNKRKSDQIRASRPDADGKWNDKYLGMAHFVDAKFEMKKK